MALTEEGKAKLSRFASARQRGAGGKFAEVESDAERLNSLYAELLPERLRGMDKTHTYALQRAKSFTEAEKQSLYLAPADWTIEDGSPVGLVKRGLGYIAKLSIAKVEAEDLSKALKERLQAADESLRVIKAEACKALGMTHSECRDAETVVQSLVTEYLAAEIREGELLAKLGNPVDHAAALKAIDALNNANRNYRDAEADFKRRSAELQASLSEAEQTPWGIICAVASLALLIGIGLGFGVWGIK